MKINVLEVINEEAEHPVEYASVMKGSVEDEISTTLSEVGIFDIMKYELEDLVYALRRGESWYVRGHCFTTVTLDV